MQDIKKKKEKKRNTGGIKGDRQLFIIKSILSPFVNGSIQFYQVQININVASPPLARGKMRVKK
jgi:hypothetical protein